MTPPFPAITADAAPSRAAWLTTLADLALLLIGFLLLIQALGTHDPARVAAGIRRGFAGPDLPALPVAAAALDGFAPGSAAPPPVSDALAAWALEATRDPRIVLTVTGGTDGTATDRDPATGSAAILASDRARALAVRLFAIGVPADRLTLAIRLKDRRAATATWAFAGEPQGTRP